MASRTPPADLALHAEDAFARAAAEVGLEVHSGADLAVAAPGGRPIPVEVQATSVATVATVATASSAVPARSHGRRAPRSAVRVLVADQIPSSVRDALNRDGVAWFDRRGHLRFVARGLFVDTDVRPQPRRTMRDVARAPINGRSGLAAAAALLLDPSRPMGVSEIARAAGLNASSVTRAMSTLVDAHLAERPVRGQYRPLVPELFWALADAWPRESVTLRWNGPPDIKELLGAGHDLSRPGWAEAGVRGAVAWGAPLVATGDFPRHWYVPDEREIRRLAAQHAGGSGDAWILSPDPIGLITNERFDHQEHRPLAHPVFCALDLSASARDREALEQWTPPDGFVRVW